MSQVRAGEEMTELRKQFEALPDISEIIKTCCYYCNIDNRYKSKSYIMHGYASYINGAWFAFQEQQKKIDLFNKMILSLRNEFNLWADDTESFNAIEAQIENLEELLK